MVTIPFDTLKCVETLERSRLDRQQAAAIASAVRDSHAAAELVTKKDLQLALAPLQAEQTLQRWMLGAVLGGIIALVLKSFF